jgi:hypothetical protein
VKNIHRYRNLNGMLYSTTFTDKNNRGNLYGLVKLINLFKIKKFVEFILDFFKEDIFVVSR